MQFECQMFKKVRKAGFKGILRFFYYFYVIKWCGLKKAAPKNHLRTEYFKLRDISYMATLDPSIKLIISSTLYKTFPSIL